MIKIGKDKLLHIGICALISFLTALAISVCVRISLYAFGYGFNTLKLPCCVGGFISGLAVGAGKEYGDEVNPDNDWDWLDFTADAIGSFIGAFVAIFIV